MDGKRLKHIARTAGNFYLARCGMRRLPSSLFWMITWECNSRCLHCEWGKTAGELSARAPAEAEVPGERVREVLTEARSWGALHIAFAGGEAFLRKDFLPIIRHAKSEGFAVTVSTNGFLLSDPAFAALVAETGVDRLDISLDAVDETHDALRGVPGSFGMVDKALGNLVALKKKHCLYVGVNTVISGFNVDKLRAIFDYARAKKIDGVGLQPFHPIQARDKDLIPRFMLNKEQIGRLKQTLGVIMREHGAMVSNSPFFVKHIPSYYENRRMPGLGCFGGLQEIHLYPDGTISPCCFLRGTDSVMRKPLREIFFSPAFAALVKKACVKDCPGCWSPPVHEYTLLTKPHEFLSGFTLARRFLSGGKKKGDSPLFS